MGAKLTYPNCAGSVPAPASCEPEQPRSTETKGETETEIETEVEKETEMETKVGTEMDIVEISSDEAETETKMETEANVKRLRWWK